jgi:hypothetical protein
MTNTETDLLSTYHAALIDHVRANPGHTVGETIAATLPDYLSWDASGYHGATRAARCGGGDPPECAGFDSFELDRTQTPAWAVEIFEELPESIREQITTEAEEAEIERREP